MDKLKEPRVIITVLMIVAVTVIASLKLVSGEAVIAFFVGMLARLGAKTVTGPISKPGDAGFSRPAALVLVLVLAAMAWLSVFAMGCGMTPLQVLKTADDSAHQMGQIVLPRWNARCEAAAVKCKADGVTEADKCRGLRDCQRDRGRFTDALQAAHVAVASGSPLAVQQQDAGTVVAAALAALENARRAAVAAGFLFDGGVR